MLNKDERNRLHHLKNELESITGKEYSIGTWVRMRSQIKQEFGCKSYLSEEYKQAVMVHAYKLKLSSQLGRSKNEVPRLKSEVDAIVRNSWQHTTCHEFYQHLIDLLEISPPRPTMYKFFSKVGGYSRDREIDVYNKTVVTYKILLWRENQNQTEKTANPDAQGLTVYGTQQFS